MRTTARVLVLVEVSDQSTWAADVTVKQVREQAGREAVELIQNRMIESGRPLAGIKVLGTPQVTVVSITEKEDKV